MSKQVIASSAPGPVSADDLGRAGMKYTAEPCSNHKQTNDCSSLKLLHFEVDF